MTTFTRFVRALALVSSAVAPALAGCAGSSGSSEATQQALAAGAVVIDVRNLDEWSGGHLAQSTLIPLPEFEARLTEVDALVGGDKSKPVIVVCRSGNRAGRAKALLEARGYTHVTNGGAWQSLQPKG